MKNKKRTVLSIVFALLAITASAEGISANFQNPPGNGKPPTYAELLRKMDENKDGKLAESEVKGPLKDDFSKVDTDKDGYISESEFKNMPPPPRKN